MLDGGDPGPDAIPVAQESLSPPPKPFAERIIDADKTTRLSRWEQDSTDAWFAAAKQQWRGPRARSGKSDAASSSERRGSDDEGKAPIGANIEADIPSYNRTGEGHVVYALKVKLAEIPPPCESLSISYRFVGKKSWDRR